MADVLLSRCVSGRGRQLVYCAAFLGGVFLAVKFFALCLVGTISVCFLGVRFW